MRAGWQKIAGKHGHKITFLGIPPLIHWELDVNNKALLQTMITERMLKHGFLAFKQFSAMYVHTEKQIDLYLNALDDILNELDPYIRDNRLEELPHGPVAHEGFKRLN
jgi:hypothetical protein